MCEMAGGIIVECNYEISIPILYGFQLPAQDPVPIKPVF